MVPINEKPKVRKPLRSKPKKKDIGTDEKLPDKRPESRTTRLAQKIMDGKISLENTPERFMQLIFAEIAVKPSVELGLIHKTLAVSADGTCLKTGASSKGKTVCECRKQQIWRCDCHRKFSDPLANIGWDSHEKTWFYGYTAFFLSTYSTVHKKDLPLTVRLVDAKRHDSLTSMLALTEFKELYPDFTIETFIGDSAMDCGPMYTLLQHMDIPAVIDLNKRSLARKPQDDITFDKNGRPVCPGKLPMKYNGSWKRNMVTRSKYRCPAMTSKDVQCPLSEFCSSSKYGRTVYVSQKGDLRLYPSIPRDSQKWRELYKQRTATERVNKQVLLDHGLEDTKMRSKHRYFFYAVMSCIDIHLKAQSELA